jgi:hypothetical protein
MYPLYIKRSKVHSYPSWPGIYLLAEKFGQARQGEVFQTTP